jgi:hypothetical protein
MARGKAFCLRFDFAIVRFGRNPQPIPFPGSTKPRHTTKPSKIRDVAVAWANGAFRHHHAN